MPRFVLSKINKGGIAKGPAPRKTSIFFSGFTPRKTSVFFSGFTLIELLVIVVIIGVLATLTMIGVNSARSKARDDRRITDIKQIATALDLYYSNENSYPAAITANQPLVGPTSAKTFMNKVPSNPTPIDGDCAAGDYVYTQTGSGTGYFLSYCLGGQVSNVSAGNKCAVPYNHTAEPGNVGSFPGNTGANPQPECSPCVCGDCTTLNCNGLADFATSTASCVVGDTTYKAIKVGAQCWMDKNVNIGTMETTYTDAMTDNATIEKWCGCDGTNCTVPVPAYCSADGALYTWAEMMYLPNSCNSSFAGACAPAAYVTGSGATAKRQGICPKGWHVPSDYEFTVLENYLDSSVTLANNPDYYADQSGSLGTVDNRGTGETADILKPAGKCGGRTQCGTTNMNIPLSGQRTGAFLERGSRLYLWMSANRNASSAWIRYSMSSVEQLMRDNTPKVIGQGVRCLKD